MSNSFFISTYFLHSTIFSKIVIIVIAFIIMICFLFIPAITIKNTNSSDDGFSFILSDNQYIWPIPGFTSITSPFGKRYSPTTGASSYHKGIDIGATQGSSLFAITSGKITFTGFLGGGGYTITLASENMKFTYCHVSPQYIVKQGDIVQKGQLIGYVGPKNVYGVKGNPYKDSQGRPTNGATTGPHLHFGVRINDTYIDPLSLFQ